ncbi:MAG: hypothetical protein ABJP45_06995 [Cyclobacteriaceae bacterium]
MEPEDKLIEELFDQEEENDFEEIDLDDEHFDEHMKPYDEESFYRAIDEY